MEKVYNPLLAVHGKLNQTEKKLAYAGGDFEAWQENLRAKLTGLLGMDKMIPCENRVEILSQKKGDGYFQINFRFESEPGYFAPCALLTPDGGGKFPLAICLQGHSTGMHISLGEPKYPRDAESIAGGRDFAIQAVRNGFCALTIEQRGMGLCGGDENGTHCQVHTMANLLIGRTTIGERVWDIQRALDVVETHFPQVDCGRVLCTGNSGGGTTTFYAACLEKRIAVAAPSCAVCTFEDSIMAMEHCTCNFVPHIREYADMGDLAGLIAPRPLVVIAGREDPIFPLKGVEASFEIIRKLYAAAGAPRNCTLEIGPEGHRYYPAQAWPAIGRYIK